MKKSFNNKIEDYGLIRTKFLIEEAKSKNIMSDSEDINSSIREKGKERNVISDTGILKRTWHNFVGGHKPLVGDRGLKAAPPLLPFEIIIQILLEVSLKDLIMLRQVSKKWYVLLGDNNYSFWNKWKRKNLHLKNKISRIRIIQNAHISPSRKMILEYTKSCEYCNNTRAWKIYKPLYIRSCVNCFEKKLSIDEWKVRKFLKGCLENIKDNKMIRWGQEPALNRRAPYQMRIITRWTKKYHGISWDDFYETRTKHREIFINEFGVLINDEWKINIFKKNLLEKIDPLILKQLTETDVDFIYNKIILNKKSSILSLFRDRLVISYYEYDLDFFVKMFTLFYNQFMCEKELNRYNIYEYYYCLLCKDATLFKKECIISHYVYNHCDYWKFHAIGMYDNIYTLLIILAKEEAIHAFERCLDYKYVRCEICYQHNNIISEIIHHIYLHHKDELPRISEGINC